MSGTGLGKKEGQDYWRQRDTLCKDPDSGESLTHLICLEEDGVGLVLAESTVPISPFLISLLFMPLFNKCQ